MGTVSKFHVKIHHKVKSEDLPNLSKELQDDFWEVFIPILEIDPYGCSGLNNHDLVRDLKGWKAVEIEDETAGYIDTYRLIYQITDTPKIKTVEIASIALHDPAYDRAHERVAERGKRK
ncbi:hypothetical protein AMR41_05835 [Hapalosiphon sp. MRB220]|nr:hypothetical protein AMR41_05835 [Hapalosiphon sp. MRB220]